MVIIARGFAFAATQQPAGGPGVPLGFIWVWGFGFRVCGFRSRVQAVRVCGLRAYRLTE